MSDENENTESTDSYPGLSSSSASNANSQALQITHGGLTSDPTPSLLAE